MVVVTGAGGFIGGHLVGALLADGQPVRAVDVKPPEAWCQSWDTAENRERLGWEPSIALRAGLARTYAWVDEQVAALSPSR